MTSRERRVAERRARARALREDGLSIRAVARELRVGQTTVFRDLAVVVPVRVPGRPVPNCAGPLNDRAVKHGALSSRLVEARARELVLQIVEANPHLDAVRDGAGLYRYATALARVERVYRWLDQQGDAVFVDVVAGRAHPIYEKLVGWEKQCDAAESQLAISPLQRARLGLDLIQAKRASLADFIAGGNDKEAQ